MPDPRRCTAIRRADGCSRFSRIRFFAGYRRDGYEVRAGRCADCISDSRGCAATAVESAEETCAHDYADGHGYVRRAVDADSDAEGNADDPRTRRTRPGGHADST